MATNAHAQKRDIFNPFAGARNNCAHTPQARIFAGVKCSSFGRDDPSVIVM